MRGTSGRQTKYRSTRQPASSRKRQSSSTVSREGKSSRLALGRESGVQLTGSTPTPNVGVVYLSFGEDYKALTTLSVGFLRRFGYTGPVRILTDSHHWRVDNLDCEIVNVPSPETDFGTRYYKTQINQLSFANTLLLDADTLPIAPICHIWHDLRFAHICLSLDLHPNVLHLIEKSNKDRERRLPEYRYMSDSGMVKNNLYNCGVMLFRRSSVTDRLFEAWHQEWNRFGNEDQLAMVRAIARTRSKVHTLAPCWNALPNRFRSIGEARTAGVKILHFLGTQRPLLERFLEEASCARFS